MNLTKLGRFNPKTSQKKSNFTASLTPDSCRLSISGLTLTTSTSSIIPMRRFRTLIFMGSRENRMRWTSLLKVLCTGLVSYTKRVKSIFQRNNSRSGPKEKIIWQPFLRKKRLNLNLKLIDSAKEQETLHLSAKSSIKTNPHSKKSKTRSSTTYWETILKNSSLRWARNWTN